MNEIKTLQNNSAFLERETVEKCFFKGKITNVDKQVCGNGFSTAFLNLKPSENKVNVIIAPNKAVIIEKQKQYFENKFNNRIKFFYKESTNTNFNDANVLFFVADSFLLMKEKLKEISHKIDKVLIDEFHSVEIQSLFRYNLIDFESKVKSICNAESTSIVTVTASPNLYSNTDILIENSLIKESTIIVSKDRESVLKRIKNDIKNGENVVLFTNSNTVIYNLRNYKNEVQANFVIGKSLTQSLAELIKIIPNENSNLTIVSSRGFEGFDIYYSDAKVYFFEDRANEYETFFISNLYQAFNRLRKGAKYIEYNRLEVSNKRKSNFKNIDIDIENFINDTSISISAKQKTDYKKYNPFVIFQQNSEGVFSMKKNDVAIQLHKEAALYDLPFPSVDFKEFLNVRKIKVEYLNEVNNRLKKKVKTIIKEKNLLSNSDLIDSLDLFGSEYRLEILDFHSQKNGAPIYENRLLYLKHFNSYLRRKNYKGNRTLTERETIAQSLLNNEKEYYKLVNKVTKTYDIRSIEKYGIASSLPYRKTFKDKSFNTVCKLILMFANERIGAPSKWIANRDYNILTEIGINEIELMADVFGVKITEVDIKNCFPRVLYGINGLELPSNFYGENKRNKLSINISINNFFYDESKGSERKLQRNNAILKFRDFGFNESVINYLITNFFECEFRGDLFNLLSFHERQIIKEIKEMAKNWINEGVIRRHDSVIIFNNKTDLSILNDCQFLNVGGWFYVPEIKVIKMDSEFETFKKEIELQDKINKMTNYDFSIYINDRYRLMAL